MQFSPYDPICMRPAQAWLEWSNSEDEALRKFARFTPEQIRAAELGDGCLGYSGGFSCMVSRKFEYKTPDPKRNRFKFSH